MERGLIAVVWGRQLRGQTSPEATREVARPWTWHWVLAEDSMDHGSATSRFFFQLTLPVFLTQELEMDTG